MGTTAQRALLVGVAALFAVANQFAPVRAAAATTYAGPLGVPAQSSFNPLSNGSPVQVRTLSGRADLVSGGDALVEIAVPVGTALDRVKVKAGARDVTRAFRPGGPGLRGLVTGLPVGQTLITATLDDGTGARLVVKNTSQGGPVFSGPLILPWTCRNGSKTPDSARPPTVAYWYKSTDPTKGGPATQTPAGSVGGSLQPYNPQSPPNDVAIATTDDGNKVPFIVREETGFSLRDQYKIAALWDPAQGAWPDPTAANPGFAHKLVLTHGVSCDTAYESGSAPEVLFENALRQGFAVASHALDHAGHNCNLVTQAESLVMTKEMVVERFGPLRYTIGSGCSGGSLVQQQVANAYPGVYQGITPQCSFPDAWSSAQQYVDYVALREYLENPSTMLAPGILPAQWPSIYGHLNPANQITFTEAIKNSGDASRDCIGVAREKVYDENTNPTGVRCSLPDYMRNVFGIYETGRDKGKARRPLSTVGVQYGLSGLAAFLRPETADPTRPPLTPDQFVALNTNVGSYDLDWVHTKQRFAADPVAQERVYRSGAVNTGAHLDTVAIIDLGGPEPGAFHDIYRKHAMRARLIREHGTAANQVFWEGQTPLIGDVTFVDAAIAKMDDWLTAVEGDTRGVPLAKRIIDAKAKAGVAERCVAANGLDVPAALCRTTVDATLFSSPRIEAGGGDQALVNGVGPAKVGFTDDRLDCQTIPLEGFVYAGRRFADVFTPPQQAALSNTFPSGVCDYSKPGKSFQAAVPWLTYQDAAAKVVYGGVALGTSPQSTPIASGVAGADVLPPTGGGPIPAVAAAALALAALVRRRRQYLT